MAKRKFRTVSLDSRPDIEFTDNTGARLLWVPRLNDEPYRSKYHVGPQSLNDWWDRPKGCFLLAGEKPDLARVKFPGPRGERLYVGVDFLDRYVAVRGKKTAAADATADPNRVSMREAVAMGFDRDFLVTFGGYDDPRRKGKPRSHPALSRPIKAGSVTSGNGQRTWLWKPDLEALLAITEPDAAMWAPARDVKRRFGLEPSALPYYAKNQTARLGGRRLKTLDDQPIKTRRGRRPVCTYYLVADLKRLAEQLPRPSTYVHTDPDGTKMVPLAAGAKLAGLKLSDRKAVQDFYASINVPNPEWHGLKLHGRPVPVLLHRVKESEPMFVRQDDCVALSRVLAGEAKSDPAEHTLTELQDEILIKLRDAGAFGPNQRCTTEFIVRKISRHADTNTFKKPLAALVRIGLVDVKRGRGGGCWLTLSGKSLSARL